MYFHNSHKLKSSRCFCFPACIGFVPGGGVLTHKTPVRLAALAQIVWFSGRDDKD